MPSGALTFVRRYLRSPSTLLGLAMGGVMYAAYAFAHSAWTNPALIGVCAVVAVLLPSYSRLSNKLEERVNLRFAVVTFGRLGRFALQLSFNYAVFLAFTFGGVFAEASVAAVGGALGIAVLTTLASQGAQYIAVVFFNRGVGDLNRNVLVALSANILATAAATTGLPFVQTAFMAVSLVLGGMIFGIGVLSDLRAIVHPRRGVGIFFGTFNPFHVTHVALVRRALEERGLSKVVIHPTVVPKLHAQALERGEIRVARVEGGLNVLERTEKADLNVNYFPTGNRFYPPETRKLMIELAIAEAGLSDRVEVLWLPDEYRENGFYGVVRAIRRLNPGVPLHGLHGSDLGGMWVRNIYDECGWIYPLAVRRRDGVSATAIRNGAAGMTTAAVTAVLSHLRAGSEAFEIAGRRFLNHQGRLVPAA